MTILRPWFLILLLLPFIFHIFRERGLSASAWSKVIDSKLLPYLLIKGSNKTAKKRSIYKIILWSLLVIGLSGPAFHKISVPIQTSQPATILILDLGPTMQGQNLKQAQQKIYDLLDTLYKEQIGLILYDKYAYIAGPLTFDADIIRQMVPSLDRSLLQEPDQNPLSAFDKADTLFKNAGVDQGRIIFITTGDSLPPTLSKDIKKYPHKVGVLGIGSTIPQPVDLPQGGFLTDSSGRPKMVKLDPKRLSELGVFQAQTTDDTDIQNLISSIPNSPTSKRTLSELLFWQDSGIYFLLTALPLFVFFFRRGSAFIILLFLCLPARADLWLRADQIAYRHQMEGVASYRQAHYPKAADIFKSGSHNDDLYNFGNALAFQQKIPEAIATYKQVLQRDPKHADAKFNKEYLERFLKKQRELERQKKEELRLEQQRLEDLKKLLELQELLNREHHLKQEELDYIQDQLNREEIIKTPEQPEIPETQNEHPEKPKVEDQPNEPDMPQKQEIPPEKELTPPLPQPDPILTRLKEELKRELPQKRQEKDMVDQIKNKPPEAQHNSLEKLKRRLQQEQHRKQEIIKRLSKDKTHLELKSKMEQENALKTEELKTIDLVLKVKAQPVVEEAIEEETALPEESIKQEKSSPFDQESQAILNTIKIPEYNVLRYRIQQQHKKYTGQ